MCEGAKSTISPSREANSNVKKTEHAKDRGSKRAAQCIENKHNPKALRQLPKDTESLRSTKQCIFQLVDGSYEFSQTTTKRAYCPYSG